MPFSWDQTIPGHDQTFKQKTIELYIDENRRLDGVGGVREFMKEHYNFDKRLVSASDYQQYLTEAPASLPTAGNSPSGVSRRMTIPPPSTGLLCCRSTRDMQLLLIAPQTYLFSAPPCLAVDSPQHRS